MPQSFFTKFWLLSMLSKFFPVKGHFFISLLLKLTPSKLKNFHKIIDFDKTIKAIVIVDKIPSDVQTAEIKKL